MALILSGSTGITTTNGTTAVADGAIGTNQLAADAVTTAKIATGAVGTTDIADSAVTGAKLENSGVTAGTYTSATVTIDAKGRVTSASSGSSGGVTSLNGQTGAITNTDLGVIGSYVIGWDNSLDAQNSTTYADIGSTVAGSNIYKVANSGAGENLNFSAPTVSGIASAGLSGTWRRMNAFRCGAYASPGVRPAFLFVRIS